LINGYGLTESSALAVALLPESHRRALADNDPALLGTVGQPVPGVELKIVDEALEEVADGVAGQIALRGAKISPGYLDNPEETARRFRPDGWLLTGDQGRVTAGGNLAVLGRIDDMIISGGINVQPGELEAEVHAYAGIAECAAFGVPSPRWGREVRLAVVPKAGAVVDPEALRLFLRTRMDPYKLPKRIHVLNNLPRTSVGKVQRFRLAETLAEAPETPDR
jgi:acyl-CoA synthetase (AMP-forming)/AMP-acid ligase II